MKNESDTQLEIKRIKQEIRTVGRRKARGYGDGINDHLTIRELAFKLKKLEEKAKAENS